MSVVAQIVSASYYGTKLMSNKLTPQPDTSQPIVYQIRLKGHLDDEWSEWFDGLTITLEENGETLLTGPMIDQAALNGLLKKVRDRGITLVSVNPIRSSEGICSVWCRFWRHHVWVIDVLRRCGLWKQ